MNFYFELIYYCKKCGKQNKSRVEQMDFYTESVDTIRFSPENSVCKFCYYDHPTFEIENNPVEEDSDPFETDTGDYDWLDGDYEWMDGRFWMDFGDR